MTPEILKLIIADQQHYSRLPIPADEITRVAADTVHNLRNNEEIIVISGIRRCGKSTLMQQLRCSAPVGQADYFMNFDDDRLIQFSVEDFQLLLEVFVELYGEQKTCYFDEIQNIPEWERFIRRLQDQDYKIYLTGSNANLFSRELGTRLTGRYIRVDLYPFSFREMVSFQAPELLTADVYTTYQKGQVRALFSEFIQLGGFPDYVRMRQPEYLHFLYESIIYRDIIVRYKLTSEKPLKELVYYLASNVGKEISYNGLRKLLGLGSATTVSEYCSYLEGSFICFFINRYSPSLKKQMLYNKKVYFIDQVLAMTLGFRFSEDRGRMLENIVFLELKRRHYEIYFHQQDKECDFILRKSYEIVGAIQVCIDLSNPETKQREYAGLLEAMATYSLTSGDIIHEGLEESDEKVVYQNETYLVRRIPIWKWLLS